MLRQKTVDWRRPFQGVTLFQGCPGLLLRLDSYCTCCDDSFSGLLGVKNVLTVVAAAVSVVGAVGQRHTTAQVSHDRGGAQQLELPKRFIVQLSKLALPSIPMKRSLALCLRVLARCRCCVSKQRRYLGVFLRCKHTTTISTMATASTGG